MDSGNIIWTRGKPSPLGFLVWMGGSKQTNKHPDEPLPLSPAAEAALQRLILVLWELTVQRVFFSRGASVSDTGVHTVVATKLSTIINI